MTGNDLVRASHPLSRAEVMRIAARLSTQELSIDQLDRLSHNGVVGSSTQAKHHSEVTLADDLALFPLRHPLSHDVAAVTIFADAVRRYFERSAIKRLDFKWFAKVVASDGSIENQIVPFSLVQWVRLLLRAKHNISSLYTRQFIPLACEGYFGAFLPTWLHINLKYFRLIAPSSLARDLHFLHLPLIKVLQRTGEGKFLCVTLP